MYCAHCHSENLVTVRLTMASGPVLFAQCRACEHRWWTDLQGNRLIALGEVLERAAA
jgi:hypothetical protein